MATRYGLHQAPDSGIHCTTAWPLAVLLLLTACSEPPSDPEAQLRAWVAALETAAEAQERSAIMDLIGAGYTDSRGNQPADIDRLLRLYFLRHNEIVLLTSIEEVRVFDRTAASLVVTVGMAGANHGLLGIRADAYRFELELEAADDSQTFRDWRLQSARWGALGQPAT